MHSDDAISQCARRKNQIAKSVLLDQQQNGIKAFLCSQPKINCFDFGSTFSFDPLIIWIIFCNFIRVHCEMDPENIINIREMDTNIMPNQTENISNYNEYERCLDCIVIAWYCSFEIVFFVYKLKQNKY